MTDAPQLSSNLDSMLSGFQTQPLSEVRRQLEAIAGLAFSGSHTGQLEVGQHTARLQFESSELLRVSCAPPSLPATDHRLLVACEGLPGNVRYAWAGQRVQLVADVPLDGAVPLALAIDEVRCGIRQAVESSAGEDLPEGQPPDRQVVQQIMQDLTGDGPEQDLVELEDGWELRPQIRGAAIPVKVVADARGLCLRRLVLRPVAGAPQGEAVAREALRLNNQLRLARLACAQDAIVAETRLSTKAIAGPAIAMLARAVAVAASHTSLPLEILAEEQGVSQLYLEVLGGMSLQDH